LLSNNSQWNFNQSVNQLEGNHLRKNIKMINYKEKLYNSRMSDRSIFQGKKIHSVERRALIDLEKFVELSANPSDLAYFEVKNEHVVELRIYRQGLKAFPESFGNLKWLETLDIQESELVSLPDSFGNLASLRKIELIYNKNLKRLPESFGDLEMLQELYLSNNELEILPETFGNLKTLKIVDLSKNKIKTLPHSIGRLNALENLFLDFNDLRNLPRSFGNLKSLRVLSMQSNFLQDLPETFGNLTNLEELNLEDNELMSLPESFSDLRVLRSISLAGNKFSILPVPLKILQERNAHLQGAVESFTQEEIRDELQEIRYKLPKIPKSLLESGVLFCHRCLKVIEKPSTYLKCSRCGRIYCSECWSGKHCDFCDNKYCFTCTHHFRKVSGWGWACLDCQK